MQACARTKEGGAQCFEEGKNGDGAFLLDPTSHSARSTTPPNSTPPSSLPYARTHVRARPLSEPSSSRMAEESAPLGGKVDLQSLSIRAYLDQTVVPVLLQGMSQLVKERCVVHSTTAPHGPRAGGQRGASSGASPPHMNHAHNIARACVRASTNDVLFTLVAAPFPSSAGRLTRWSSLRSTSSRCVPSRRASTRARARAQSLSRARDIKKVLPLIAPHTLLLTRPSPLPPPPPAQNNPMKSSGAGAGAGASSSMNEG